MEAASEPQPEPAAESLSNASEILTQVEFYFGDANLPTDKFLMKAVRKDPDGWVDLSLIAGFARMKKLSKDIEVIVAALQPSGLLELSEDRTQLRRTTPLPAADTSARRTVVVENLDRDVSIDSLTAKFRPCGAVKVRARVFLLATTPFFRPHAHAPVARPPTAIRSTCT